jgi:hypothetical protein
MNIPRLISSVVVISAGLSLGTAQQRPKLGDNAALRYYAAFAQLQDAAITNEQAKKLNGILDGPVPFIDNEYKDLIEKNRPAIESMTRGSAFSNCDWGLDYQLSEKMPVDYVRQAMALGRLNVLYAFHLQHPLQDNDGSVRTLVAGVRFSHDVANGGPLIATLAASDLLTTHLRAIAFSLHLANLSAAQKTDLRKAVTQLGPNGLDWQSATRRDLESLRGHFANDPKSLQALERIIPVYVAAINDPSRLPVLQTSIERAPHQLAEVMPNPHTILADKQNLTDKLAQTRDALR